MKHYKHKLNTIGYGQYLFGAGILMIFLGLAFYLLGHKGIACLCFIVGGAALIFLLLLVVIELHQDKVLNEEALAADAKLEAAIHKKSFALPYGGGMIWSEHLDGLYTYKETVIQKLKQDLPVMLKPSSPSVIAVALAETKVDEEILIEILSALTNTDKRIQRVAFIGLDKANRKLLQKMLQEDYSGLTFLVYCTDDFEKAKEWLIS